MRGTVENMCVEIIPDDAQKEHAKSPHMHVSDGGQEWIPPTHDVAGPGQRNIEATLGVFTYA
jgi:hypothetical protein